MLVDDGSSDGSAASSSGSPPSDPRVRVVYLSRNFGHQTALTAGLDHARGDAVVMLDADLQDPPELIPRMLDHWRAGCDVVYAVREQREGESRFKLTTARWFYKLFDKLAQVELQHNSGDFRLLDRRALDALLSMRERNRFLRGMTVWVGYTQAAVPYQRDPRYAGETKYTLSKMLRFSLDAISSFSHRPLQLATLLGFLISTLAFIAIPVVIVLRIARLLPAGVQLDHDRDPAARRDPADRDRDHRRVRRPDLRRGQGPAAVPRARAAATSPRTSCPSRRSQPSAPRARTQRGATRIGPSELTAGRVRARSSGFGPSRRAVSSAAAVERAAARCAFRHRGDARDRLLERGDPARRGP